MADVCRQSAAGDVSSIACCCCGHGASDEIAVAFARFPWAFLIVARCFLTSTFHSARVCPGSYPERPPTASAGWRLGVGPCNASMGWRSASGLPFQSCRPNSKSWYRPHPPNTPPFRPAPVHQRVCRGWAQLTNVFEDLDKDSSGTIDMDEATCFFQKQGTKATAHARVMFERVATRGLNGQLNICLSEWLQFWQRQLAIGHRPPRPTTRLSCA